MISLGISLTTTPMMCALFLRNRPAEQAPRRRSFFDRMLHGYERTLRWALDHQTVRSRDLLRCNRSERTPDLPHTEGLLSAGNTGRLVGSLQADQSVSFKLMTQKLRQMMAIVQADPAVDHVVGYTGVGSGGGFGSINTGSVFVSLKPLGQRPSIDQVIARLRGKLAQVSGGRLIFNAVQDIRAGGRQSNAQYQYTLQADNPADVATWSQKLLQALEGSTVLADLNSDQQQKGLETDLVIDRDTASRFGITPAQIDNTLYDAYGQRQVSVIYSAINQYHVVMEIDPRYTLYPNSLQDIYVSTSGGGASGTQTSNITAGSITKEGSAAATTSTTAAATANNNSAENAAINALATGGKGNTSCRRRGQHRSGDDGSALGRQSLPARQYAAVD